ncbi:MAG: YbbR-like domain-containing protein [Planctomycetota bacterium]|jgi:hypothetical protein
MSARLAEHRALPPTRFSRQWYLDHAGTISWIVIITVLIWVWADLHFTDKRTIPITLAIQNTLPKEMVILSPQPAEMEVDVTIKGRKYALDRFEKETTLSFDAARLFRKPGPYPIDIADVLESLPEVRQAGKVISCEPKTLLLRLDGLKPVRGVKVQLELPGMRVDKVKLEPESVTLRIPISQFAQEMDDTPVVTARPDTRNLPEGEPVTRTVTLVGPTPQCRMDPDQVTATFTVTVGQRTARRSLTVPIHIHTPKQWWLDGTRNQYVFQEDQPRQRTARITVAGPQIELDKLQADKKPVESWLHRKVRVEFRKDREIDVSALTVEGPLPEIKFRLIKPPAPAGP